MTQLDVLFRYAEHPTERGMFALSGLSEVYGIRSVRVDSTAKTIRVEFDATRLTRVVVAQLLRRAGIDIVEEISLIPPQPAPAEAATTA
jgi:copper chaperone CopZ